MASARRISGLLRENGLRATKGRAEVLALFFETGKPLAQRQIMEMLRLKLDRASVYRILNAFTAAGVIHMAYVDGRHRVYELPDRCSGRSCHPHFSCRSCGMTACLEDFKVHSQGTLGKGFVAERQKVLIEGLCPDCTEGKK
ncbi:MAG: transcriptional repressor [Desulfobacteraceae bacterium]|nr:transcriptional repressor [Desulfobacteraceae bacterium]